MRIQPVKRYRPPALPLAAWHKADPKAHASRCGRVLRAMAGLGLAGTTAYAALGTLQHRLEMDPAPLPRGEMPMVLGMLVEAEIPPTPAEETTALLRVAPNLLEAMAREGLGTGAFGCIVTSPPCFLTEEEGVAIIRAELEKVGLPMADAEVTLPSVRLPQTSTQPVVRRNSGWMRPADYQEKPAPFVFDGVSRDGRVLFEFVSMDDFKAWRIENDFFTSVDSIDLVAPAQRLAASLAETKDEEGRFVLVFCDPAFNSGDPNARPGELPAGSVFNKPSPRRADFANDEAFQEARRRYHEEAKEFYQAYYDEVKRKAREAGREQLRRQLAPQIAYLREEGILPPAAAAP